MIQTYWLGPTLLILHDVEILADSVVYAGVLAVLFLQKERPGTKSADEFAGAPAAGTSPR